MIAITDSKLPDGLSVQFPCTRDSNINDPYLTFVLHGDLYFKRIYVHPLTVFYFPNQDLGGAGGGGEGSIIFFLLIKRHGMSKIMYDVGGIR